MKILLGGALGRMGREVTAAAAEAQVEIVCGVDVAYTGQPSDYPIVSAFDQARQKADVLIDFSRPSALPELLQLALPRRSAQIGKIDVRHGTASFC